MCKQAVFLKTIQKNILFEKCNKTKHVLFLLMQKNLVKFQKKCQKHIKFKKMKKKQKHVFFVTEQTKKTCLRGRGKNKSDMLVFKQMQKT